MPELPEVETVVRGLRGVLTGSVVVSTEGVFPAICSGLRIGGVRRYGKFIVIDFDAGMLFVHLGMTGQLTMSQGTGPHTRGRMVLNTCVLRYDDIRKFGKVFWAVDYPKRGPEPMGISTSEFVAMFRARRGRVKALLLNQAVLRGIGNIYADETLFRAGIHPEAVAARLSKPRLARLHSSMLEVLEEAIAAGGSSISDYVDATGQRGSFQSQHRVYGKAGQPCPVCGATLLRTLVSQRGTTHCARCQSH